jgi:hypothetical protein
VDDFVNCKNTGCVCCALDAVDAVDAGPVLMLKSLVVVEAIVLLLVVQYLFIYLCHLKEKLTGVYDNLYN